jgi:hypothetical protein
MRANARPARRAGPIVRLPNFARRGPTKEAHPQRWVYARRTPTQRSGANAPAARCIQRNDRLLALLGRQRPRSPLTCGFGARGGIRTLDLPITSRMLSVGLDGSRRIEPAHVGCAVGLDGSRQMQKDRLDDHRDDQSASDKESDAYRRRPPLTGQLCSLAWSRSPRVTTRPVGDDGLGSLVASPGCRRAPTGGRA